MAMETIRMDVSRYEFTFSYSRRPSRPLPRTPRFHRYSTLPTVVPGYRNLPPELWEYIHQHLPASDLKSLALVNKRVGMFARDQLGRRLRSVKTTGAVFRSFFSSHHSSLGVPAFAFKIRSLTLHLSPSSQHESPSPNAVLKHWVWVSRNLNHLRELAFLGTTVPYMGHRDLLVALPPSARLRAFVCEDDSLLRDSMTSLLNHAKTLEDFGGFFDIENVPPQTTPDNFLAQFFNVRTLEVGRGFIMALSQAGSVANLSVRLEWEWMLPCVRSLSWIFGTQLRALRLDRERVVEGESILDGATKVSGWESPMFLCGYMDMPALRYLEVRDTAPTPAQKKQQEDVASPSARPDWAYFGDYDGVLNLDRLAWRPTWAANGGERRTCADAFVRSAGDMLPVLTVWMSLEERTSGIWDTWTRLDEDLQLERKCVWGAVKGDSWKRMA